MKRSLTAAVAIAVCLLAGCGVRPSDVTAGGQAPTGVAPGVTLYFVDGHGRLVPQRRETGRLGTISEAVSLLLTGPGNGGLRTDLAPTDMTRVVVDTSTPGLIRLRVPLAGYETTQLGVDQIVCTALGVHVQSGGPRTTKVQVILTSSGSGSDRLRTCPLIT